MNLFNDEGYKQQGFNKRFRFGGNLTYHQPNVGNKVINYGFNANLLADKYGDFFIWRSPQEAYRPSPFTNMGRKERAFYIDPFFNFTNPDKQTSHKLRGRIYYRRDRIFKPSEETDISDVTERMGTDMNAIANIANGDLSMFYPLITPAFQKDWTGVVNSGIGILNQIFPSATTSDYCDLIAYAINHDDDYISYNKLFERYFKRLCQYVYSILLNKDDAEDVVQDLFLNLWKYRKRIEITGNASHYIFRMAKHLALNSTRSTVSFTSIVDQLDNPRFAYIDDSLEKDEFRIALYDCIDRLPQRSREVFLLERVEGMGENKRIQFRIGFRSFK